MRNHLAALALTLGIPASNHVAGTYTMQLQSARQPAPLTGQQIARRMVKALKAVARVQVTGSLTSPHGMTDHYVLRYEATAREYVQETGGMWAHVQVGNRTLTGLQSISIGTKLYSSTDGKHWLSGIRMSRPTALDAISVNPVMAPCCVSGPIASAHVQYVGIKNSPYGRVYALQYQATSMTASIYGTLLVDSKTYHPLQYSEYSRQVDEQGAFTITYGGSFHIEPPQSAP